MFDGFFNKLTSESGLGHANFLEKRDPVFPAIFFIFFFSLIL